MRGQCRKGGGGGQGGGGGGGGHPDSEIRGKSSKCFFWGPLGLSLV